jgi:hypothetical protein
MMVNTCYLWLTFQTSPRHIFGFGYSSPDNGGSLSIGEVDLKETMKARALLLDFGADPSASGLTINIGFGPILVCYNHRIYLSISSDRSNISKQSLQDLFNKGGMFIGRDDVSEVLYNMIIEGFWDQLTYKNRCIKEVLKHRPHLDKKYGHGRTLLHIPFAWREDSCRKFTPWNGYHTIRHLKEILYALIPAGADIRAMDFHGETITETANRRGVCRVWERALKRFGYDAKSIIAADLRVGLTYCSIDGTLVKGARKVDHDPKFICDGCSEYECDWEDDNGKCEEDWPWDPKWPQWNRRPCERYYSAIQRGYKTTEKCYYDDSDDYITDEEYEAKCSEDEDEEDETEEIGNEDCKKPRMGVEEQCGSSKIDRDNRSTSPTSG